MIISNRVVKSICFVCAYSKAKDAYTPVGTAFFFGFPMPGTSPQTWAPIVITALHVIAQIEQSGSQVFLRVNTQDGGFDYVNMPFSGWIMPDQDSGPILDAAAHAFPFDNKDHFDYGYIGGDSVATKDLMSQESIGVGNDVYIAGLFVNHIGVSRNEPIMRSGFVSAMPDEEILTSSGYMPGYLIECRSLGGLSGSPVFVEAGLLHQDAFGALQYRAPGSNMWYLLGIIRGHWDTPKNTVTGDPLSQEHINTGIAIVTPFDRILPLIAMAYKKGTRENEENERLRDEGVAGRS